MVNYCQITPETRWKDQIFKMFLVVRPQYLKLLIATFTSLAHNLNEAPSPLPSNILGTGHFLQGGGGLVVFLGGRTCFVMMVFGVGRVFFMTVFGSGSWKKGFEMFFFSRAC